MRPSRSRRRPATRRSSALFHPGRHGGEESPTTGKSSSQGTPRLGRLADHRVLIDRSVIGWKEFELEVMRDGCDNVVIVCSIENFDPMGVHTGDSITVAPAMTLSDAEYQEMRNAAIAIIREIGVDAGGCNIQFAVEPGDGGDAGDRDEPPRLPKLRPRIQGHRVPDRPHRSEARRRLQARRDRERDHPEDDVLLRAGARLRRGQGAALRVREVPDERSYPRRADEGGRRGDGDRSHLPAGLAQGIPGSGERPLRLAPGFFRR